MSSNDEKKPVYIVKGYDDSMKGTLIRACDEIRASNRRYYDEHDRPWMDHKSNLRLPTYGNCNNCLRSGPVNKKCNKCDDDRYKYTIMVTWKEPNHEPRIIDAEYLSRLTDAGHEVAMADRIIDWEGPPSRSYATQFELCLLITRRCMEDAPDDELRLETKKIIKDIYNGRAYPNQLEEQAEKYGVKTDK